MASPKRARTDSGSMQAALSATARPWADAATDSDDDLSGLDLDALEAAAVARPAAHQPLRTDASEDDCVIVLLEDPEEGAMTHCASASSRASGVSHSTPAPSSAAVSARKEHASTHKTTIKLAPSGGAQPADTQERSIQKAYGGGVCEGRGGREEVLPDDDDLQVTGHEGHLALVDFPHAREHCVMNVFGTQQYCKLCFCIVCDSKASDCTQWAAHCTVKFADVRKKRETDRAKARARQQPSEQQLREYFDDVIEQPGVDLDGLTLRMVVSQIEQRHGMVLGSLDKKLKKMVKGWALERMEDCLPLLAR
eukprot:Tamp_17902.p1 GENE.Tamp_17902~~Tamp_17902.p1  ORF type:complete len:329 (+),score=51.18 Tamp_17902:61-987(+)